MKHFTLTGLLLSFAFISCNETQQTEETKTVNNPLKIIKGDTCQKIDKYLDQLTAEKNFSGGLLILKNGKRIFMKGYGLANREKKYPFTSSTLASVGSITKAFTATAIMKLYEQGKINMDDKLEDFFDDVPSDKAGITIHQLLTHSSGFHEFLENDGGDYEKLETNAFLKRAFDAPLAFKPGEKAVYTNVGMSILGIIIEKVSGHNYETFLKKELFEPLGIKHIGYQNPQEKDVVIAHGYNNGSDWGTHQSHFESNGGGPYWNLKANGGLEASLEEMTIWLNAFTNKTVLADSNIQKMFSPHIAEDNTNGQFYFGYGCNLYKSKRNTNVIENGGSNGIYFARIVRLPEEGLVFYMVTNESTIGTNLVLPNVMQLFFDGEIKQDAFQSGMKFENPKVRDVYEVAVTEPIGLFEENLNKKGIVIDDDMILLEAGNLLREDKRIEAAFHLYLYYTKAFPNIVVAWNDLGDIYLLKNDKTNARKCYQQALTLRPGNERAKKALENL